ncbi:MAG: AEC family transporter, partial [Akkermansia sp.]|nr:AEC family transporter [Akkermansia sp.]
MFDIVFNSFLATIPVFVFFAIGFWLRRKGALEPQHDGVIMQLAMDIGYPCLIFYNIMKYMVVEAVPGITGIAFSAQAIACGFAELLLGVGAAWLVAKALRLKIGTGLRTFTLTAGVQNYAFFVIPIVHMLFHAPGDPSMGVLFIHNMGCELFVWSVGVILMCGGLGNLSFASLF